MKPSEDDLSRGLVAVGSAGGWQVDLDEAISDDERWVMKIEGPSVYLNFEVESPRVIDKALEFLMKRKKADSESRRRWSRKNDELKIGKCDKELVTLVRDDEFADRYFLAVQTATKLTFRVTFGGKDLVQLES